MYYGTTKTFGLTPTHKEEIEAVISGRKVSKKKNSDWKGKHACGPDTVSNELTKLCQRGLNTPEKVKPILIYMFPEYFNESNYNTQLTNFLREEYDKGILCKIN